MANIFLSYSRDDAEAAGRVARSLEDAGHSVWWDQHINAGSRFSKEIDAALRASELVVVLWSESSIESTWVQDEAAVGRDSGRLIPVVIDGAVPPLGFRQFQAITLSRRLRKLEPLHAAIALKLGEPPAVPRRRARSRDRSLPRPWRWVGGLALLALLAGLSFLLLRPAGAPSHIVAVIAADSGDPVRSEQLARTIAADLGRYRAGSLGALTIIGGKDPNASKADYRVEVGVSATGANLRADVSLLSPRSSQI
ncbi:MAG: toll/interleukin-1 receptor domain-containing protein, partial [Sphingomicrobium sp.]